MRTITIALMLVPMSIIQAEPSEELTIPPRLATPGFVVEPLEGGYRILLDRATAVALREATKDGENDKDIAEAIKAVIRRRNDEATAEKMSATINLWASQTPILRKALEEKIGPGGIAIRVWGVPKVRKDRPLVRAIVRGAMPEELRDTVRGVMLIANTTPLYWKAEPRE